MLPQKISRLSFFYIIFVWILLKSFTEGTSGKIFTCQSGYGIWEVMLINEIFLVKCERLPYGFFFKHLYYRETEVVCVSLKSETNHVNI